MKREHGPHAHFARDAWASYRRWMRKSIRNPFMIFFGLAQPIVWLVLFTQVFRSVAALPGFGAESYLAFFLPTVIVQTALFSGSAVGIGLVEDLKHGLFNKILASPAHRSAVLLGKTAAGASVLAGQIVILVALGALMGVKLAAGVMGLPALAALGILLFLVFGALSNLLAVKTMSADATIIAANMISLPLLFVSTAFMPAHLLPAWLQLAVWLNPLQYAVEGMRAVVLEGWSWDAIGSSGAMLLGVATLLAAAEWLVLRRAVLRVD